MPDVEALQAELDAHATVVLFGGVAPDAVDLVVADPIRDVDDTVGVVIWP